MSMDHVTYHVPPGTLDDPDLETFIIGLGFEPIPAKESVPEGWKVAWYERRRYALLGSAVLRPNLHLVETPEHAWALAEGDQLALGHMCVCVDDRHYRALQSSKWCVRNSGSGRIWMEFANLRFEVRPL